jgi:hypothetical protein
MIYYTKMKFASDIYTRRMFAVCLILALTLTMTACSSEPAPPEPSTTAPQETAPQTVPPKTEATIPPPMTTSEPEPPATTTTPAEPVPPTPDEPQPPSPTTVIATDFEETLQSHFGFMPAQFDYKGAREAGGGYDRPNFEIFQWGMIEREPGFFDFHNPDRQVRESQAEGLHILANLQPFAMWDQAQCHPELSLPDQPGEPKFATTKGKPCDMEAYKNFVSRLVERYDGDNIEDMPGLTVPIKHWEVMNEPEFSTGDLIFFQGNAVDYFEILKATHEAVKAADPEAYVVQGGMAGMMDIDIKFWQEVFDLGGAAYLDIMNMHSIGHGEHLNIPDFKRFLDDNGITGKPIWVTEVQYQQSHQTQDYNNEDFAGILARSYIFALANGVDNLLYVNLKMPPKFGGGGPPFDERSALITDDGGKSALFHAHATIAGILGDLSADDTVETIRERVGGWHIDEGQYRFIINGTTIYALWGSGAVPPEITGQVRVIDITGAETVMDAGSITLTDSPVFVIID